MKIGRIYKIIHCHSNICYVGSTFNTTRDRWQKHKYDLNSHNLAIYDYIKKYGHQNFRMILIKEYEVVDRKQLLAYEQLWINKLKPVNRLDAVAYLKKQKTKEYEQHRKRPEDYAQKQKKYREENKEKIAQKKKEYREINKEKIAQKKKEKYTCECGATTTKQHKLRHERSKKHQAYINSN